MRNSDLTAVNRDGAIRGAGGVSDRIGAIWVMFFVLWALMPANSVVVFTTMVQIYLSFVFSNLKSSCPPFGWIAILVAALSSRQKLELDERGFVLLENLVSAERIAALKTRLLELFDEEGENAGGEFMREAGSLRLANLIDKGEIFRWAIAVPEILAAIAHILGPEFKLSSLNARSANPRNETAQPLHVDMSAVADERGFWVANVVWMLDDFTPNNGATRVVPGSQTWGRRPQEALNDPSQPHPQEELITGKAGTLAVMNAHAWHGGTPNQTDSPRLALHAFYCRRDKPQQQFQKQMLRAETQASLSPELRDLLALDDRLNDELSAAVETRSGFLQG